MRNHRWGDDQAAHLHNDPLRLNALLLEVKGDAFVLSAHKITVLDLLRVVVVCPDSSGLRSDEGNVVDGLLKDVCYGSAPVLERRGNLAHGLVWHGRWNCEAHLNVAAIVPGQRKIVPTILAGCTGKNRAGLLNKPYYL